MRQSKTPNTHSKHRKLHLAVRFWIQIYLKINQTALPIEAKIYRIKYSNYASL